jgi:acetolactate synthase I/II/III large subunit
MASIEALGARLVGRLPGDEGMLELRRRILARINDRAERTASR